MIHRRGAWMFIIRAPLLRSGDAAADGFSVCGSTLPYRNEH
ncbi:hypothetical protein [Paenibacillus sp. GbtcB18]|nr:hypothetical protein [Paenibacillus sp. GbtcB18]